MATIATMLEATARRLDVRLVRNRPEKARIRAVKGGTARTATGTTVGTSVSSERRMASAISAAIEAADGKRSIARFAIALATILARASGVSGRISSMGRGWSSICRRSTTTGLAPLKGTWPASIW